MVVPINFLDGARSRVNNNSFSNNRSRVNQNDLSGVYLVDEASIPAPVYHEEPKTFQHHESDSVLKVADGIASNNEDSSRIKRKHLSFITEGEQLEHLKCIILPHSDFRSYWDIFIACLLIYVGVFIPYRISFLTDLKRPIEVFELFVDISFGIDIILNFFTAYESPDGQLHYSFRSIAKNYLRGYFLLDFIATVPLDKILEYFFNISPLNGVNKAGKLTRLPRLIKILRIARLVKVLRLYRFKKWIREIQINYSIHQGITRLINIVIVVLFATHLVGCLWHSIGVNLDVDSAALSCNTTMIDPNVDAEKVEVGWVCREGLTNAEMGYKYVSSLYWAFSTLTTVGYGDISARTVGEQTFSMIMMLLGVSWYAYAVGSMSTILSSFDKQNKQARMKMIQVNTFIRDAKLPPQLGHRVRRYFEYALSRKQNGLFGYDADEILEELSSAIRTEVICFVEARLIDSIPFFRDKSRAFVAHTIQLLQPMVVQEGDFIIREGSASDEMYFLIKGVAAVYYGSVEINRLHEGSYFGEIGCILGGVRRAGIVAVTICELQCLSRQSLTQLLGQYPSIGDDLKRVAMARMKTKDDKTTSSSNDTTKLSSNERSQLDKAQEMNAKKLENVDFSNFETTTQEFVALKNDVEKITRKLSLTSGKLPTKSHVMVDGKLIQSLNGELSPTNSEKDVDDMEGNSHDKNDNINKANKKNSDDSISRSSNNEVTNPNIQKDYDQIIRKLSENDRDIIQNYVYQSILHHSRENILKFSEVLMISITKNNFIPPTH